MELSESKVIEPSQTNITLSIPILNDETLERNESFSVQLVAGESVVIEENHATVWIVDDDGNRITVVLSPCTNYVMFSPLPQLLKWGFGILSTWFRRAMAPLKYV